MCQRKKRGKESRRNFSVYSRLHKSLPCERCVRLLRGLKLKIKVTSSWNKGYRQIPVVIFYVNISEWQNIMFSMYLFFITQLDSSLTVSLSEDRFVLIDLTCSKTVNSLILNLNSLDWTCILSLRLGDKGKGLLWMRADKKGGRKAVTA